LFEVESPPGTAKESKRKQRGATNSTKIRSWKSRTRVKVEKKVTVVRGMQGKDCAVGRGDAKAMGGRQEKGGPANC